MQSKNKSLAINKEVNPIIKKSLDFKIAKQSDMPKASELLSNLNRFNDRITEEKEKVTKPLNEALKAERNRWKPMETALTSAINHLRQELSSFQTSQIALQKTKTEEVASKIGSKLTLEQASKLLVDVPTAIKTTSGSLVKFRTTYELLVTSEENIPRDYYILDKARLLLDLKEGKQIAGASLQEIQTPINYR